MLVEMLTGVLIGYAVLAAVAVVALPRRHWRAAPQDRATAGSAAAAPTLVATRSGPDRARSGPGVGSAGADDVPTGTAMLPLDVWDAAVVVLVVGMVLAVPVVGGVVAALVMPFLVLAPLLVLRHLGAGAPGRPA
jgi:hypothetical protein